MTRTRRPLLLVLMAATLVSPGAPTATATEIAIPTVYMAGAGDISSCGSPFTDSGTNACH